MNSLISKLQFNNFEPGEFIDNCVRTYEETIELIEHFPWEEQRKHIIIDVTNPSITIHGKHGDYLKIALFFNGKFVLYYLDINRQLFTKSFTSVKYSYQYIRNFFEEGSFDTRDFKKEITWFKNNALHFISLDFKYIVTPYVLRKYILSSSGVNLTMTAFFFLLMIFYPQQHHNLAFFLFIFIFLYVVGGGINLTLIANYYYYTRKKMLVLSKGNDTILYGDLDNPETYSKKNISFITIDLARGSRNPISGFSVTEIGFTNGTVIKIPSLLLDHYAILKKFTGHTCEVNASLPWMQE